MKKPLLLCAATRWEALPLAQRLGLKAVSPSRFEGVSGERDLVLLMTEIGPKAAANSLAKLLSPEYFHYVLSVGFAGALQPGMASGDIIVDIQGADAELCRAARELAAAQGLALHFGPIRHCDQVLFRPEQKRLLGQAERASAVDMETSVVRQWALGRQTPSLAVRVVLDAVDDRLPSAVPAGHTLPALAGYALKHIGELPIMLSTGLKARRAGANLARFLEGFLPCLS